MENLLKSIIPAPAVQKIGKVKKQIRNFRSLASNYGQWRSIRDWSSVDKDGNPIPWYTYPATEYLSHLDFSKLSIFEYGSGNSTLWWAKRSKSVTAVEDDEFWYTKVRSNLGIDSIEYLLEIEKDRYISSSAKDADIFIIDGKHRRECAEHVASCEREGVMIILDNSDWYPKTTNYIRNTLSWMQIDFHGFEPINNYTWTTSIFVNPSRHKELVYNNALDSRCGLVQIADNDCD
jgi:hypothetical protein